MTYTPEMQQLRRDLQDRLTEFTTLRENEGTRFVECAIDVSAILGELLCIMFAPINDDTTRHVLVAKFAAQLPTAVDKARDHVLGLGPTVQ